MWSATSKQLMAEELRDLEKSHAAQKALIKDLARDLEVKSRKLEALEKQVAKHRCGGDGKHSLMPGE